MRWLLPTVVATVCVFAPYAWSQVENVPPGAAPSRPVRPIPEAVTFDQKLLASEQVFIGTGHRIYFADRLGREASFENAYSVVPGNDVRLAILEVRIDRELYSTNTEYSTRLAKFPLWTSTVRYGGNQSGYEYQIEKFVGKSGIYFTMRVLETIYELDNQRHQVVATVLYDRFVNTPAQQGPTGNPLPLTDIPLVLEAINNLNRAKQKKTQQNQGLAK